MKISTSTPNFWVWMKMIDIHNQLGMKSSKGMKFGDGIFHFHSKFWVWMKNNQQTQPTLDEIIVWMKNNQRTQTNSG
jgi:hypothetical protein